jgi:hypothetical protein
MSSFGLCKSLAARMAQTAHHVLVIGGGYGGMSVVSNLLNLANGGKQLPCPVPIQELDSIPTTKPNITLLDERDGICMCSFNKIDGICIRTDRHQSMPWDRHSRMSVKTSPGKHGWSTKIFHISNRNRSLCIADEHNQSTHLGARLLLSMHLMPARGYLTISWSLPTVHEEPGQWFLKRLRKSST